MGVLGSLRDVGWVRTNVDLFVRKDNLKLRNCFNKYVLKADTPGHSRALPLTDLNVGTTYMRYLRAIVAALSAHLPLDNPVMIEGTYMQVNPGGTRQKGI